MAPTKERPATKTIATNREARHEYFVLEALETGVVALRVQALMHGKWESRFRQHIILLRLQNILMSQPITFLVLKSRLP